MKMSKMAVKKRDQSGRWPCMRGGRKNKHEILEKTTKFGLQRRVAAYQDDLITEVLLYYFFCCNTLLNSIQYMIF